ncbi:hypothetical protein HXY33_04395 [Candidatus Bathyarchaeota archaeon]|nr:hypothetical protein [Candidatus Bathyarchaeota archaeon]
MTKWRTVRVRQELVDAVEGTFDKNRYQSLSEFVSEAVQIRLDELKKDRKKMENSQKSTEYPLIQDRLLFTSKHMWALVTSEGNVRIGLSDYAQTHMEGIISVQIDPVGSEVKKEKPFGVVETWLFKFDLNSPVSGKIIKINNIIHEEPSTINKDPYETGWVAEFKPDNVIALEEELRDLMTPSQYKTWISKMKGAQIVST